MHTAVYPVHLVSRKSVASSSYAYCVGANVTPTNLLFTQVYRNDELHYICHGEEFPADGDCVFDKTSHNKKHGE